MKEKKIKFHTWSDLKHDKEQKNIYKTNVKFIIKKFLNYIKK